MRKAISTILSIFVFILTPVVLLGWTVKFTLLSPNFYGTVIEKSGIASEFTRGILDEYVTQYLHDISIPYISQEELDLRIERMLEDVCAGDIAGCSGDDWAQELDRWLNSSDPITTLNLVISLEAFKQTVPGLIEEQYVDFLDDLPECTAEDAQAYVQNPGGSNLPLCRPPEVLAGLAPELANPEQFAAGLTAQISQQLDEIPSELSTRALFAGDLPNLQLSDEQIEVWDQGAQQFRDYLQNLTVILWVLTGMLIWMILGAAAAQIPYWRKVMQWSTLPATIPASVLFLIAGAIWLISKAIADLIFVRTETQFSDVPMYLQELCYQLCTMLITSFFGRVAIISGVIALTLLVIYAISFTLKKRE